jgi:hypothetical protein
VALTTPLDLAADDPEDEVELPVNGRGVIRFCFVVGRRNTYPVAGTIEVGSVEPTTPSRRPRSDSFDNPFVKPFTPSKRMKVLRASLASTSSTSYLVSGSPIAADSRIIAPQREVPEPFVEPDWDFLLDSDAGYLGEEDLVQKVKELQGGLLMARDCLRAKDAVIESAHATNVVLELTCQRQRTTLHQKEATKLEKKDKRTLFGDGKAHVVTDDDFILALEEIEERDKEKEEGKEKRKEARAKAKELKAAGKKAWERALEEWKEERKEWEEECQQLKESGYRRKELPKAPKKPRKADVVAALGEGDEGDGEEDGEDSSSDEGENGEGWGPNGYQVGREDEEEEEGDSDASEGE